MALHCGQAFKQLASQRTSSSSRCTPAAAGPCSRQQQGAARRPRRAALRVHAAATDTQSENTKVVIQKTAPGEMPFPWSEKDPYKLPVAIERVQKLLITKGAWRHAGLVVHGVGCRLARLSRAQSWQGGLCS